MYVEVLGRVGVSGGSSEFIFGIKLSWDNRHQLHTSLLQQLGCHGNYSDTSISPLSLDVLSSYLA